MKARLLGGATQVFKPVSIEEEEYKQRGVMAAFTAHAMLSASEDESFEQVYEAVTELLSGPGLVVLQFKDVNGDDVFVNLGEVATWVCRLTDDEEPVFRAATGPKGPFA
jgi:hypothetical protein